MHAQNSGRRHGESAPAAAVVTSGIEEQAVLVRYDLPGDRVVTPLRLDVDALVDSLEQTLVHHRVGVLDGVQRRRNALTVFAYGADAERLWRSIAPVLVGFPQRPTRVTLRYGWFGAPERTVAL